MSSVFDSLFGGEHQKSQNQSESSSTNQAYPYLQNTLSPLISQGVGSQSQVASLLGLNGAGGQNAAFDNYKNSAGYNNLLNTGSQAITGNQAAKGLLGSGATGTGLQAYGQNFANNFLNNYLTNANTVTNQGLQGANALGGAGGTSQSSSTGTSAGDKKNGGLGSFIGNFL